MNPLLVVCFFTFLIHVTETLAYSMRLSGLRTKQIAIAMSFVTSTLLVSRLSNMFQAPLLGAMVDGTILVGTQDALTQLLSDFRIVIFSAFLGVLAGAFLTPTIVELFQAAIRRFKENGSLPRTVGYAMQPAQLVKIARTFRLPRVSMLNGVSWSRLPKMFLIMNVIVASIYTIGVLCSLLAGANLPEFRATAIQLSGIVNGIATILLTIFVDPSGARITDQAVHGQRSDADVKSVVFFLVAGRLVGTLVVAQVIFWPFTYYIMVVTELLTRYFS